MVLKLISVTPGHLAKGLAIPLIVACLALVLSLLALGELALLSITQDLDRSRFLSLLKWKLIRTGEAVSSFTPTIPTIPDTPATAASSCPIRQEAPSLCLKTTD